MKFHVTTQSMVKTLATKDGHPIETKRDMTAVEKIVLKTNKIAYFIKLLTGF